MFCGRPNPGRNKARRF